MSARINRSPKIPVNLRVVHYAWSVLQEPVVRDFERVNIYDTLCKCRVRRDAGLARRNPGIDAGNFPATLRLDRRGHGSAVAASAPLRK